MIVFVCHLMCLSNIDIPWGPGQEFPQFWLAGPGLCPYNGITIGYCHHNKV